MKATVEWTAKRDGVQGTVRISQRDRHSPAVYEVSIDVGRPGLYGFHIHQNPATGGPEDLEQTCASCGGHFNPLGKEHGSVLNSNPDERHAGDLINNVWADENGHIRVTFEDDLAILIPSPPDNKNYTVIGKSLVLHQDTDDLGRGGRYEGGHPPYIYGKQEWRAHRGEFVRYSQPDLLAGSAQTGNAGSRMACGNIVRVRGSAQIDPFCSVQ